jgi:hypothetical protein
MNSKNVCINSNNQFEPHQIICLDYEDMSLYSEVIQVISQRNLCWSRPLFLAIAHDQNSNYDSQIVSEKLLDLRFSPDLILSLSLFRLAFDTEIIPFLPELKLLSYPLEISQFAREQLNLFIQQVCHTNREIFQV